MVGPGSQIMVVGSGLGIPGQFTVESLEALRSCREIHTILSSELHHLLPSDLQPKIRSLTTVYLPGRLRRDAYWDEVNQILEAAARNPPVAYLTLGNPILFDSVTQGLLAAAQSHGLRVQVFPAVSSIDTVLIDLLEDAAPGIQIFDATSVVAYRVRINPEFACLLLQPSAFGTAFVAIEHEPNANALEPLRAHLLRFYPADHEIAFVSSGLRRGDNPSLTCTTIGHLGEEIEGRTVPGASIYVPRLMAPTVDPEFATRMASRANFDESFRPRQTGTRP